MSWSGVLGCDLFAAMLTNPSETDPAGEPFSFNRGHGEIFMDALLNPRDVPFGKASAAAERPVRPAARGHLTLRRKLLIGLGVLLAVVGAVLGGTKLAVRHDRLPLFDMARSRSVPVDLYVRRDKAMA